MQGYLVLARCGIDDVPMGLFDAEDVARVFANDVTEQQILQVARQAFGLDTSIIHGVSVIKLDGGKMPRGCFYRDLCGAQEGEDRS